MTDTTTHHGDSAEVRRDIDDTREHLGQTVDEISDRVMPGRIIERRKEKMGSSLQNLRRRVMGTAESATHGIGDSATSTIDSVRGAPSSLAHRTEGSPLAAGGVAFAIGFLAAAIWRPSESERQAVEKLSEAAPQLGEAAQQMGQELTETVKQEASDAASELKSTVQDSAQSMKSAATDG